MTNNIYSNIIYEKELISPNELKKLYPINKDINNNILIHRNNISNIIRKKNSKLLVICGPCSIHDFESTIEYAKRLKEISEKLKDKLYIVMRAYLEKPRTSVGWKGFINDPDLNESYDINKGLHISRKLLIELLKINIPLSTEILNLNTFKYINDIFSWAAIGARTTESQIHREIVSGINFPIGFKNNTNGDILVAINAMKASYLSNTFIYINDKGKICITKTKGNNCTNLILRGSVDGPNYFPNCVNNYIRILKENNVNDSLIIDCSHDNSYKDHNKQIFVSNSVINQINNGNNSIVGLMIESNIFDGKQTIESKEKLKYGISITDSCIGLEKTEFILKNLYMKL